jgi:hypothetical protein
MEIAMSKWKSVRMWVKGLLAAVINGFASGVVLIIAEPTTFNIHEGAEKLFWTSVILGLLGAANYLKQNPLPEDDWGDT